MHRPIRSVLFLSGLLSVACAIAADVPAPPTPAAPAALAPRAVVSAQQVIQILDDTVEWYRTLGSQQQNASEPSDLLILFANRQTADQVVDMSFQIARANAELLSSEASAQSQGSTDSVSPQQLTQREKQLDAQRQSIQKEIADDRQRLAAGGANSVLAAKIPELQGELAMADARRNLLDTMAEFASSRDAKGTSANALKAQIDAIAASIPSASTAATATAAANSTPPSGSNAATPAASATLAGNSPSRYGIWELGTNVLALRRKLSAIETIDQRTTALSQTFQSISAAPLTQLQDYATRSDALALQADSATGAKLTDLRSQFDTLAWLFKQTAAIVVPLSKEQVLLRQYRHNLSSWRGTTQRQYQEAVAAFTVRLGILGGMLAVVFLFAEIWRHAVLRFAHEPRGRSQLLLVRQIVTWAIVVLILGLNFFTELSSFATFAGLITAGVAVAMQSVLVSVVGYFFLIGKYGIRVGDRVQIGNVSGEVIDLGLVRMHLMELSQSGPLGPTGRVVAFANLIVFQASGGLFKQIPGVSLSWHETLVKLPDVTDYMALKQRLLAAVEQIVGEHREEILRQSRELARRTESSGEHAWAPQVQMHLVDGHMEALIRYPAHRDNAAEVDERVSQAILTVIHDATASRPKA